MKKIKRKLNEFSSKMTKLQSFFKKNTEKSTKMPKLQSFVKKIQRRVPKYKKYRENAKIQSKY